MTKTMSKPPGDHDGVAPGRDDKKTKVKDKSNEHLYFTITPRLVWALCDSPDEYTLWCVIKDIAGEGGECILAREDLAALAMISSGRVSACRDSLIRKKLLEGENKRDPGYPQSVWHLSVPDFWEANTRWARMYPKIADRVRYKKDQSAVLKAEKREASQGDGSRDASQGDGGMPRGDGGMPRGDGKKIVLEDPKEEEEREEHKIVWEKFLSSIDSILEWKEKRNVMPYLERTTPIAFADGVLTLAVPDPESCEWLESRMSATINRALPGITQVDATVSFIVTEKQG